MTTADAATFVQLFPDPAIVVTRSGKILARNEAFIAILGEKISQGEDLADFVEDPPEKVDEYLKLCARTRPSILGSLSPRNDVRRERYVCEGGLLCPRQNDRDALVLLRFRHAPEAIQRFQALSAKIDELHAEILKRRRVEAELREMRDTLERRVTERTFDLEEAVGALQRSNKALEEFAYVASHDLNEPLRKIRVFGDILQEELEEILTEENRSILNRIRGAAERMQRLIQGLLDYSRIATRSNPPQYVDLNEVVQSVLTDLEIPISERKAYIEVGELPAVTADPVQMQQLFQNLLSNSLKFAREGIPLRIRIECTRVGESICELRISDNGIGFEEHFSERIFEPFQRLHTSNEYEGTGIGLAICRKIIERHQGRLIAESHPGEGATFRILFPIGIRSGLRRAGIAESVGMNDLQSSPD